MTAIFEPGAARLQSSAFQSLPRQQIWNRTWTCPRCRLGPRSLRRTNTTVAQSAYNDNESLSWTKFGTSGRSEDVFPRPFAWSTPIAAPGTLPAKGKRYARGLRFAKAMLEKDSETVLRVLSDNKGDKEFIRNIPATTFTEILRLLDPGVSLTQNLVEYTQTLPMYHNLSGGHFLEEITANHILTMYRISQIRREHGLKLGLTDYKLLLKGAAICGKGSVAEMIWADMETDQLIPDIECRNALFASHLWNGYYERTARYKHRTLEYNLSRRRMDNRSKDPAYNGYAVGLGGVKELGMAFFNKALQSGSLPTEDSMCLLMLAHAREADLAGVSTILQRVWHIDVGKVTRGSFKSTSARQLSRSSAIYPSERILLAIADAYGSNSDSATALRLVSAVADAYGVTITSRVWKVLFEWAFVLSRNRSGRNNRRAYSSVNKGRISLEALTALWNTMSSAPHNVQLTIAEHNHYVRALAAVPFHLDLLITTMHDGAQHYYNSVAEEAAAKQRLAEAERNNNNNTTIPPPPPPTSFPPPSLAKLRSQLALATYVRTRNALLVRRWVRLFLAARLTTHPDLINAAPNVLRDFADFAPWLARYSVRGGIVELHLRDGEEPDGGALREGGGEEDLVERFARREWVGAREGKENKLNRGKEKWHVSDWVDGGVDGGREEVSGDSVRAMSSKKRAKKSSRMTGS